LGINKGLLLALLTL